MRGAISRKLSKLRAPSLFRHLSQAIHYANRAGVSFYTIDARGLVAMPPIGAAEQKGSLQLTVRGRDMLDAQLSDVSDSQNYLAALAVNTGGLYFQNSNDLSRGLWGAHRDIHNYYLLGYRPPVQKGKSKDYHEIRVKVPEGHYRVRARRGYLSQSPKKSAQTDLFNAFSRPDLYHSFSVSLEAGPAEKSGLTIDVIVPSKGLLFQLEGNQWVNQLEIYGMLRDSEGNWLDGKFQLAKNYTIELEEETYRQLLQQNVVSRSKVKGKPGRYTLVVVVKETPTGAISTAQLPVVF